MKLKNLSEYFSNTNGQEATPGGGGGTPPPQAGDTILTPNAGANGAGNGAAGNANPGFSKIELGQNWTQGLPEDIRDEASLKNINDFNTLVKNYVYAQKAIGADKVVVPSKHATEDDWKNYFRKAGLPEDLTKYEVNTPKDIKFDEQFYTKFKEVAFQSNILPKQAQALLDWYGKASQEAIIKADEQVKIQNEQGIKGLKEEWGAGFDKNITRAKAALQQFGDKDLVEFMNVTGLGNNPKMLKMMAKVGELISEKDMSGLEADGGGFTPKEAGSKIESIMGNPEHPYFLAEHPGHKAAVEEMKGLYAMKFPKQQE